jgi:hypothetical protein
MDTAMGMPGALSSLIETKSKCCAVPSAIGYWPKLSHERRSSCQIYSNSIVGFPALAHGKPTVRLSRQDCKFGDGRLHEEGEKKVFNGTDAVSLDLWKVSNH